MSTIVPEPTDRQTQAALTYDDMLCEVVTKMFRCDDSLTRALAEIISATLDNHASWAAHCKLPHWHEDVPCDEFERAFALAHAWLMSRGDA